jgi:hypothetical protein
MISPSSSTHRAASNPDVSESPSAGSDGPWHVLGRKASALWGNKVFRRTVYALGIALLTLNLLEFPRQVLNPANDVSCYATFEYHAAHHLQFGKEVFQNGGPYGYVHYGYVYAGYLPVRKIVLKTLYRLGLVLLILWAGRCLPHPALRWCWWATFFIFQPFTWPLERPGLPDFVRAQEMDWEQDYGYLTVYLAALYLLQNRRGWRFAAISGLLLFFLSFAALTKHTTFVLAACAVGAVVLQKTLRRELLAATWTAVAYVLFLAVQWLVAGQALANFPGFVRGILAFTAGFNEAQLVPGPLVTTLIGLWLAALLCLRSLFNWRVLNQGLPRTLLEVFLIFTAWKHGFVLEQFSHVMTFFFGAVCFGILVFHLILPVVKDPPPFPPAFTGVQRIATSLGIPVSGFGLVLLALALSANTSDKSPGAGGGYHPGYWVNCLRDNLNWIFSPCLQMANMREQQARAEAFFSLPRIKAEVGQSRVDFFGMETGWVLLNRLTYWCRPMPAAYAAFNGELAQANEAFLRDARTMPEYVICHVEGSNHRFIPQIDALAFQALLDNYTPVLTEQKLGRIYVLLKRNSGPPRDHLDKQLLFDVKTQLGYGIPLHAWSNQIVWIEVEIRRSLLGKALSLFYRPRLCYIGYHCAGTPGEQTARFMTQLGRGGCILTPLVENNWDLLALYAAREDLSALPRVQDFRFFCEPGDELFFDKEIHVRLYAIPPPARRIDLIEAPRE